MCGACSSFCVCTQGQLTITLPTAITCAVFPHPTQTPSVPAACPREQCKCKLTRFDSTSLDTGHVKRQIIPQNRTHSDDGLVLCSHLLSVRNHWTLDQQSHMTALFSAASTAAWLISAALTSFHSCATLRIRSLPSPPSVGSISFSFMNCW